MDTSQTDDSEFSNNVYKNNMELFFNPEIERRKRQNTLPENFMLIAAQAIFSPDGQQHTVRLNDEVSVEIKLKKGVDSSSPNFWPLLDEVEHIKLNEKKFLNCGHSTLILFKDGFQLTFDFHYNKQLSLEHLSVAKEFLEISKYALKKNFVFAFIDNSFSAIELLAKTSLFLEGNKSILRTKSHDTINTEFNRRFKKSQTNFEIERRKVFNRLSNIRTNARYLNGNVKIEREELMSIANIIEKMFSELSNKAKFNHN